MYRDPTVRLVPRRSVFSQQHEFTSAQFRISLSRANYGDIHGPGRK